MLAIGSFSSAGAFDPSRMETWDIVTKKLACRRMYSAMHEIDVMKAGLGSQRGTAREAAEALIE